MSENNNTMTETYTQEDWLRDIYSSSESTRSVSIANCSLKIFDRFCEYQKETREELVTRYQKWLRPDKVDGDRPESDIRSICLSLGKFVQFMNEDHPEIIIPNPKIPNGTPMKKKAPKTIKLYFGFIKAYLRKCHNIKLSTEDIKDFVVFPKQRKDVRQPVTLEQLKLIMDNASPKRRALYYVLISSGMRLGEALSLKKSNFHFEKNPVRADIEAEWTKTKEARETFISSEAVEKIKQLLGDVFNHKPECDCLECSKEVFSSGLDELAMNVNYEVQYFTRLRVKIGEKLGHKKSSKKFAGEGFFKKYPNSVRFVVNIHSMRAYFITKASQKHGSDYGHALSGHGSYLKQYIRIPEEERAKQYLELETDLLIESVKTETDKINLLEVNSLKDSMKQLQDEVERLKKYPQTA